MKAPRRAPRLPLAGRSSDLGHWLQRGADRFAGVLRTRLAAAGITHVECAALRELYRLGRTSPTLLVLELGMTKGAVSKVIDQLREKELVARWIVEEDQRQHVIELTRKGDALVPELQRLADEADAECFGHLSERQRRELRTVLEAVCQEP